MLGQGGASVVWRVQDQALGILVALKILRNQGSRFNTRLEREAVLASRVVHPNVIPLHDVGTTPDNYPFLAFALASDGSMLDLAAVPPRWPELMRLIIELLRSLAALHARGILHLDVKLSNLLLHRSSPRRRSLWLADLGVARARWGDEEDSNKVVGTVSYMAPERLTGQFHLWCPSTDLFSVGAVVYRLLCGSLPYPARDPTQALSQRQRPPSRLKIRSGYSVPPGLDNVVLPMLEPQYNGRFDLSADVIRALEALPGLAPDETSSRQSAPPVIRRRPLSIPQVPRWHRPDAVPPPERLFHVHLPRRVPQTPALLMHREIPLIGRQAEFDRLWAIARRVIGSGRPQLVEISGPWGAGRSRLVREFTQVVEQTGFSEGVRLDYSVAEGPGFGLRGAWGRVAPVGSKRDHYLSEVATMLARDRGAPVSDCIADAQALCAWTAPEGGAPPPENRAAPRALLVEHLERRAWRGLSWLWLEDAHLADENDDCWAILEFVLQRDIPVMVMITSRADAVSPSLMELRARHHDTIERVELHPLSAEDSQNLVQVHLPLEASLSAQLARHAAGNPRTIRELLQHWVRSGQLVEKEDTERSVRLWTLSGSAPPMPRNRRAFARERLSSLGGDTELHRALLILALAGGGAPAQVAQRVAGEALDRLIVDGFVDVERGTLAPVPPELLDVVLEEHRGDRALRRQIHRALATSWRAEGDSPEVQGRIGRHLLAGGRPAEALRPLALALQGLRYTLPVPALIELAERTLRAIRDTAGSRHPGWIRANEALLNAQWRENLDPVVEPSKEDDARASRLDIDQHVRVTCAQIYRLPGGHPSAARLLDDVSHHRPRMSAPLRAVFFGTQALVRAQNLDLDGALAGIYESLACRPDPEAECRVRLLKARLLSLIDPMISWHEALRTVELARGHGLLRYEVLAWGLAADKFTVSGRANAAVAQLRSGIARLEAHGERRAAAEARLHLGTAYRAAGRLDEAAAVWRASIDAPVSWATVPLTAREMLAVLAAMRADPKGILALKPGPAVRLYTERASAWQLLISLAELLRGGSVEVSEHALLDAPLLGGDGIFLGRAIALTLQASGRARAAENADRTLQVACRDLSIDADATDMRGFEALLRR